MFSKSSSYCMYRYRYGDISAMSHRHLVLGGRETTRSNRRREGEEKTRGLCASHLINQHFLQSSTFTCSNHEFVQHLVPAAYYWTLGRKEGTFLLMKHLLQTIFLCILVWTTFWFELKVMDRKPEKLWSKEKTRIRSWCSSKVDWQHQNLFLYFWCCYMFIF